MATPWAGWDDQRFAAHPVEVMTLVDGAAVAGVRVEEAHLDGPAEDVTWDDLRVSGAVLVGSELPGLHLTDCLVTGADLAAARWHRSSWRRVEVRDARLTGAVFERATLSRARFVRCRIDGVDLAEAELADVRFEDCDLTDSYLGRARLEGVAFVRCDLAGVDTQDATFADVDLRTSSIDRVARVGALRGARVDLEQVLALAPRLAVRAGLVVDDGGREGDVSPV